MNNTISVTEVPKRLPQLLRDIQRQPDKVFKITVHNQGVAEIKAPSMVAEPGQAAKKLLAFRKRHPHVHKTRHVEAVSENIKTFLYGDNNKS